MPRHVEPVRSKPVCPPMMPTDPPHGRWYSYLSQLTPLGVVGIYVAFALVLLVLSDVLLPSVIAEPSVLHRIQTGKGIAEVLVSAGLIYVLVSGSQRELRLKNRAIDEASIGITLTDPNRDDNPLIYVNEGFERITGYDEASLLGENCRLLQGEDTDPEAVAELAAAIDEERSATVELKNYREDGTAFWNEITVTPIKNDEGVTTHFLGFQQDVSERKRRERDLETVAARFEALVEHFPNGGVFIYDENLQYSVVGGADFEEVGLTAETIQGKTPAEVFPPDLAATVEENNRAALNGDANTFEVPYQDRTYHVQTVPLRDADGEIFAGLGVAQNVTERREREQKLHQPEQTYRNLFETAAAPINLIDDGGDLVWGNEAAVELLGLEDRSDLRGRSIYEFLHPEEHETAEEELERVLAEEDPVGPTDFRIVREDGEQRFIRTSTTAGWYEGKRVAQAIINDVTALHETQEKLRRNEQRYRTLVEMSPDPLIIHVDGNIIYANDAFADLVDSADVDSILDTHLTAYLDPFEHELAIETARRTQRGEQEPTSYRRTMETLTGDRREIETTSRSIPYDGMSAVLTIIRDRTEEYRYRQALETLHAQTREMYRGETVEAVAQAGVSAATNLMELPGVTVYTIDETRNELVPEGRSDALRDALGEATPISPDEDHPGWTAFVEGETRGVRDEDSNDASGFRSRFFIPLGTEGLLVTGSIDDPELSELTVELCDILGDNIEGALERVERKSALETRDDELERKSETLAELDHLTTVVQAVHRSLFDASTREAAETTVCDTLGDQAVYSSVWIGHLVEDRSRVMPETTAGNMNGLTDEIRDAQPGHPLQSLALEAVETGEVQSVSNVLEDAAWADHRKTALAYGFRSIVGVPISVDAVTELVLVIHAPEPDAFSERHIEVFLDLGRMVAMAMDALGESHPQLTGATSEVELDIGGSRLILNRLSTELDAPITLQGAIPIGEEQFFGFVQTPLDPPTVEEAAAEVSAVEEIEALATGDESNVYRVTAAVSPFLEVVYDQGAQLTSIAADDGAVTVTVHIDASRSVREFVEEITDAYPETTLVARRSVDDDAETPLTFQERVRQACTDRQYQALRAAYFGGYYEWPRTATNEDLATGLGISSPTFQSHRRAGEQIVISSLFEPSA
ncbi:MAG: PAS domain S-box-containing protein [Halobacteriales archaeon]|jgi:PAS domain S-box-containing protein